tara:strand:+ start:1711 stop:2172 length:462 start_codon:yes stop_codon:yes gene_type:complete
MSGEEKLNEFLEAVDSWVNSKTLAKAEAPENINKILNFRSSDLKRLTSQECICYSYELFTYAEYVETIKTKENVILEWADSSIWYIISTAMNQYGTQYTKWQEKYYSAIKENPLASEILKIKNHSEARVKILNGKSQTAHKMAELLNNLSKRR